MRERSVAIIKSNAVSLILNYRRINTYALNVVLGALESNPLLQEIEVHIANGASEIVPLIRESRSGKKVAVVLWSFYSPQFIDCIDELKIIKSHIINNIRVIHIAGGVHSTAEPQQTAAAGFDLVAIGEGEKTINDLLDCILHDEDYHLLKGIAYNNQGEFISNGSGERIDLNDYPPFTSKYHKFNPIEITRGCIYACKFCQTPFMFKARFRHRTIENICEYAKLMKDRGLTDMRFISPSSLSYGSNDDSVNLEKIEELLISLRSILGNNGKIFYGTFPSEVRPEHVTRDVLLTLKRYVNNNNLIIGGQSGSQRILDLSHRGHTVEDITTSVRLSLEVGFLPNVDFIFGMPGETTSDVKLTMELAEILSDMGARIHGHTFMPLPGTPYKNAPPGVISNAALRRLKRLESRAKLYGQWKQQVSIADSLASIRRSSKETQNVNN